MSEKNQQQESHKSSVEGAGEQLNVIRESLEKAANQSKELNPNEYQKQAEKLAISTEKIQQQNEQNSASTQVINLAEEKKHSYRTTLENTQKKLSSTERIFSKFIHSNAVDKTSELMGKTVARPTSMLSAFAFSAIGSTIIYIVSYKNGYGLNNFYYVYLLLVIGFGLGLVIDILRYLFKKIKNN